MITIHQRYRQTDRQTDEQTDRQTTCDRNTALCTKVHRALKMHLNVYVSYNKIHSYKLFTSLVKMLTARGALPKNGITTNVPPKLPKIVSTAVTMGICLSNR